MFGNDPARTPAFAVAAEIAVFDMPTVLVQSPDPPLWIDTGLKFRAWPGQTRKPVDHSIQRYADA